MNRALALSLFAAVGLAVLTGVFYAAGAALALVLAILAAVAAAGVVAYFAGKTAVRYGAAARPRGRGP